MAEFQKVMQQWSRMCNAVPGKSECISICRDKQSDYTCPMYNSGLCNKSISSQTDKDRLEGEKTVMAWAAEHPEPEYPTWYEYLFNVTRGENKWPVDDHEFCQWLDTMPIPADIAQKLGIEPKEDKPKKRKKDMVCGNDYCELE